MRVALVVLLLIISACSLFGPKVVCDDASLAGEMTCAEVLSLAREQLADVSGISTLTAVRGHPCQEDSLGCGPDIPATTPISTVYADLTDGRRLAVRVFAHDDGGGPLRADPPQDMGTTP